MKKSLFRPADILELSAVYILCFSLNFAFDYVKTIDLDSYILKSYFRPFLEYQLLIVILFTFIVVVFHYQMLQRKRTEIFCRILVGGTVFNITTRYIRDSLTILIPVYLLSILANAYLDFNFFGNFYLVLILVTYILISSRQVWKYENF